MNSPRNRKLQILRQLGLESEPISLSELIQKLNTHYSERTIRRWLKELEEEGLVSKTGFTKNTKYLVVRKKEDLLQSNITISSHFSSESLKAMEQIKKPLYEKLPSAYNDEWFDSYIPNQNYYLSSAVREQLCQAGQRANNHDPAGTYAHQIFNKLLIDLSYNSSRLEGNTYSLLDTERLLLLGDVPNDKLDEEKIMILNHKEAIRYLVENAPKISVNTHTIYTLHYLLADSLLEPKYCGKVRDHGVRIGGSTYLPYENSRVLQNQLARIAEKAVHIEDPFEQCIFLLIHVSYLQAFADVNKRTARLCANIPLIIKNLVPSSFNDIDRDDYMSAMMAIYELQDVRPIVDLFVFSYIRTCAAYDSTVKAVGYDAIRARYRTQRRMVIREIILDNIVGSRLEEYVLQCTKELIQESEQKEFYQDVMEDLKYIDENRIVGMGITSDQLKHWENSRHIQ